MSHEKEQKEKSGKMVAAWNLKEKRTDKAAKRSDKAFGSTITLNPFTIPKK